VPQLQVNHVRCIFVYVYFPHLLGVSCIFTPVHVTICCGLWPPGNTTCLFLTWYQSYRLAPLLLAAATSPRSPLPVPDWPLSSIRTPASSSIRPRIPSARRPLRSPAPGLAPDPRSSTCPRSPPGIRPRSLLLDPAPCSSSSAPEADPARPALRFRAGAPLPADRARSPPARVARSSRRQKPARSAAREPARSSSRLPAHVLALPCSRSAAPPLLLSPDLQGIG
jgi:hypothetical protein